LSRRRSASPSATGSRCWSPRRAVTPAWGAAARLTATLTDAIAKPLDGAQIALERLTGAAWTRVAAGLPNGEGRVAFAVK